jgi:serine/threonine-protein kinase RsbW
MTRFAAEIMPNATAIARLTSDISAFLSGAGVDARAVHHVGLVIDEILTNVGTHGGNASAEAAIAIDVHAGYVFAEIADHGIPFDPRVPAPVDTKSSVEDREIGGLGLHLVRQLTSKLCYHHDGTRNRTTFCIPREHQKG